MHQVLKSWVLTELKSFEIDWYKTPLNQSLTFNYWVHQNENNHEIYLGVIVIASNKESYLEWLKRKTALTKLMKVISGKFFHNVYGVFGRHDGTGMLSIDEIDKPKKYSKNLESRVSWLKHNWDPFEFKRSYAAYNPDEIRANQFQLLKEQLNKLLKPKNAYKKKLGLPSVIQELVFDSNTPIQKLFREEKVLLGVKYYEHLWRTHLWFRNGASLMIQHLPPTHFFFKHYNTEILPIQGTFRKKFVDMTDQATSWFIAETSGLVSHRKADFIMDAILIPRYSKKIESLSYVHRLMLAE